MFTAVDCGDLADPGNGTVLLALTTFSEVAIYECNENYTLEGTQNRICQDDGNWSGNPPTCECKLY